MTDAGRKAVDKLNIIKNMAQQPETKEVAKVVIEYIEAIEQGEVGFTVKEAKK